jgi:predicted MPP superfamily phosphohydrolase
MRVQIYSDLHLDHYDKILELEPLAPVLILAGDIGNLSSPMFREFMRRADRLWERVFFVLGNHEFYHGRHTYDRRLEDYTDFISKLDNVVLLKPGEIQEWEGRRIIGCTLWSDAKSTNSTTFRCVRMRNERGWSVPISLDFYRNIHASHRAWLTESVRDGDIVVTHFPVTHEGVSHSKYDSQTEAERSMFSTELVDTFCVKDCVFIAGHTHFSYDFERNGNRFISNQRGYPEELKESRMFTWGVFDI